MSTVQDAFYATCHDAPGGCESLAPRLGTSPAVLRNKANPHNTANVPSLKDADQVMGLTGDYRILHALCANHGHVAVPVDAHGNSGDMAVLELVTHVWAANGNVGAAVDNTLADGRVELRELKNVRAAIYRTQQALLNMLARLEEMAEPEHQGGR
ncbi:hypothetical protein CGK74_13810 [Thauera propionica]|uniref:Phage regulatory protein CII n=1 Tax=Thauera propionica TaxID=2019431 RepID=A0A235EW98_9RHOO|nr:phage regulatory CII family protein [Thauera propionica]OYD53284.1 hypothetical protein CGK74_13810 [Thauera propionica]